LGAPELRCSGAFQGLALPSGDRDQLQHLLPWTSDQCDEARSKATAHRRELDRRADLGVERGAENINIRTDDDIGATYRSPRERDHALQRWRLRAALEHDGGRAESAGPIAGRLGSEICCFV
jgi:hypothetical protein